MQNKEPQEQEVTLDLEDIIREFSNVPEDGQPLPADLPEDLSAAQIDEFSLEDLTSLEPEPVPEELLPPKAPAQPDPMAGDTVRIDPAQVLKGVYSGAQPLEEAEADPQAEEEPAEPFSEQWEPEYEQPMGEYVPQPVLIHPQSRLRELKQKLADGPEKRYYALTEKGTGKLQVLLFISIFSALICTGCTVLYALGMVQPERLRLMIFGQLFFMLLSALLGSHRLVAGIMDVFRGRCSMNTLLVVSLLLCAVDGVFCLQQLRVPCCAAFTLMVSLSLLDALLRRRTEISQMDTLRKATHLIALRKATEPLSGQTVLLRADGQVEDFMEHYNAPSLPEKIASWYALGALAAAIAVGVTGGVLYGVSQGFQIAAITLLAAVPASFFICFSRPAAILEKRLHKLGALWCGWDGVRQAKGNLLYVLNHRDLFPVGTTKLNGVKYFGTRNPDEVVAYAAALITAEQNGLAPLFEQLLESRNCHHLSAQNLRRYDGGIGAEVRGEPVLVGTLSLLRDMGVEIPEGLKVGSALYVSIDGMLCGLFAINYERTLATAGGLNTLCSYRGLRSVIHDGDFLLTSGFLRHKFGIKTKRIAVADQEQGAALAKAEPDLSAPAIALSTQQNLAANAFGLTGARTLHTASYLGLWVHIAGGVLGIGIMLTLTLLGATYLLTPLNVMLYQLIWSIPGLVLTEWTRLI